MLVPYYNQLKLVFQWLSKDKTVARVHKSGKDNVFIKILKPFLSQSVSKIDQIR